MSVRSTSSRPLAWRSGPAAIAVAATLLLPLSVAWPSLGLAAGAGMLAVLAWIAPASGGARAAALLVALLAAGMALHLPWQVAMLAALAVFAMVTRASPSIEPRGWRDTGALPRLATLFVGGVTPFALTGWMLLVRPDLQDVRAFVPDLPFPLLVLGGVLFAVLNATLEELVWRGVLQGTLAQLTSAPPAIVLPAVSFGLAHANGFPRGVIGVGLVTVWGVLLGILRQRSGGLRAVIAAHIVADATIAVLVLGWVR